MIVAIDFMIIYLKKEAQKKLLENIFEMEEDSHLLAFTFRSFFKQRKLLSRSLDTYKLKGK